MLGVYFLRDFDYGFYSNGFSFMFFTCSSFSRTHGYAGSSIVGTGCPGKIYTVYTSQAIEENCTIYAQFEGSGDDSNNDNSTVPAAVVYSAPCTEILEVGTPGSNLFVFTWIALAFTVNVCFRWKAQQALQFAQAHGNNPSSADQKHAQNASYVGNSRMGEGADFDDDDDDLDEFEDAAYE